MVDARNIDSSTGVYIQRLLYFLNKNRDEHQYTVLVPSKSIEKWQKVFMNFTLVAANQPNYSFAEQISLATLLRKLNPDLVHFTMPQQPLLWFGDRITTIHDTTLIRFENIDMNPVIYRVRKFIFRRLMKNVIRRSKSVLVPTEFVRGDLIEFMHGKYADKITVTLEAGDPVDAEPEEISWLKGKKFLFFVGNAFPYKNIGRTIEAYAELKKWRPELQLVLAGKKDYFYEKLEAEVKERNLTDIHFLGFISDGEKRWCYQNAQAFVSASLSEGFHIPLLEAMYEDCPVISSNVSCLPEVAGNAARYFDPHSTKDLVTAIEEVLDSSEIRAQLVTAGRARVKQFSWQKMTEETRKAYFKALKK